jgi:hypothetical protein
MAGRGPAPKDPSTRARRNKDGAPYRVVEIKPGKQPTLISVFGRQNPMTGEPWRKWTLEFWKQLDGFPSTVNHLPAQWSSLARAIAYEEAAILGMAPAAEGRLRMSKHGVDPDDLMRLRILTVEADVAEQKRPAAKKATAKKASPKPDPRAALSIVS